MFGASNVEKIASGLVNDKFLRKTTNKSRKIELNVYKMIGNIMKLLFTVFLACGFSLSLSSISIEFLNTSAIPFQPHTAAGFGSYLVMNLNNSYLKPLIAELNATNSFSLRTRAEAHITIISPPEFNFALNSVLTMEDINQIALEAEIQSSKFEIVCLAKQSQFDPKLSKRSAVFNLIVESPALLAIRNSIQARYEEKGGEASNFDAQRFYPHITLAFEEHGDWFPEDQVFKTKRTCISKIDMKST